MTTDKQIQANRQNALQSTGPKTPQGKSRAAANALTHGLLAKEVVITVGEGAEDQQAFDALLADLLAQHAPVGALEEMLVEKLAVCCWRLRRANRFEVGVLRKQLDTATDDYYDQDGHLTDTQIDEQLEELQIDLEQAQQAYNTVSRLCDQGAPLNALPKDDPAWSVLFFQKRALFTHCEINSAESMTTTLRNNGYDDARLWELLIDASLQQIYTSQADIKQFTKDKATHKLRISAQKQSAALPHKDDLNILLRYETAIERQFYRAISQLERLQRQRAGDAVPPPVQLDVHLNGPEQEDQYT